MLPVMSTVQEIETDAEAGRLDSLAEEALAEHRAGKTRPL